MACGIKNVGYSFGFPEQATATVELRGAGAIEAAGRGRYRVRDEARLRDLAGDR